MKRSSDGAEADAGQPDDPPDRVGVDDEVLALLLGGPQAEPGGEIMDPQRPEAPGNRSSPELLGVLLVVRGQGLQPQGWRPDLA